MAVLEQLESKLQPPWSRPGLVCRAALVDRLMRSESPVIAIVAPPGYGKTTVLAQWSERNPRRIAWVSLDDRDNDPGVFTSYITAALDRVEPIDPATIRTLVSTGPFGSGGVFPRFARLVSSREPFCLVVDHLEAIHNHQCLDALVEIALHLPVGSQLAVASRHHLPLPMALLRSQGQVVEIGVSELAMGPAEADALLAGAGVAVTQEKLAELLARTAGWPVALYLAALSLKADRLPRDIALRFGGEDRNLADYLRSEVLSQLPPETNLFLRHTAVLDELSGPLCDAVLDTHGSVHVLESLQQSNLLLVPLDGQRQWYRYHDLFRDLLRNELARSGKEQIRLLHGRAAVWLQANGHLEQSVAHAQAAGDTDRAAHLVTTLARPMYAAGRMNTALEWLQWFEKDGSITQYPQIAVLAALGDAITGRTVNVERWADIAEAGSTEDLLPDGSPLQSWVAVLGAVLLRRGLVQMRADAELARRLIARQSPFEGTALFLDGLAHLFGGDSGGADSLFSRASEVGLQSGSFPIAGPAFAERAAIAIDRHDWSAASGFADEGLAVIVTQHLEDYLTSTLVYAVAARTAAHRGDIASAKDLVIRASRLRPMCTYVAPFSTQFLLQLGHAHLELADPAGARAVLRQVRDILERRPGVGLIAEQATELQAMVDTTSVSSIGASSLSVAELRLLPYLSSHLTFREIGDRTYVSRHTIKSQAMSIYRKLGVSSRGDAVRRALESGLLGA